jgi:hypothetical protein
MARSCLKNSFHVGWGEAWNAEPQHSLPSVLGFASLTPTCRDFLRWLPVSRSKNNFYSYVAWMERSEIQESKNPDYGAARLHPGYMKIYKSKNTWRFELCRH